MALVRITRTVIVDVPSADNEFAGSDRELYAEEAYHRDLGSPDEIAGSDTLIAQAMAADYFDRGSYCTASLYVKSDSTEAQAI